ncbi:MAG: hypothetical protein KKA31_02440 [Candidatus Margulisbacteria bacterium]|nr:hypothetical protein [Candidatus Margulisiibacteriota bacterium]
MFKRYIILFFVVLIIASSAPAKDFRPLKLKKFLDRFPWSPLRGHEHEIVYCADLFGIDYRLYVAIAGAESSFGKRYPRETKNLTGYNSCNTAFDSIYHNIYETSKLIGTRHYYEKYRATQDIKELVYVYKGVPPFDHYIRNLRFALDEITAISVEMEKQKHAAWLARLNSPEYKKKLREALTRQGIVAWYSTRYDQYRPQQTSTVSYKVAKKPELN